jgi:hypothetical protein
MAFYIVTGKLGSGKSLVCVSKIQNHLRQGLRVATNLDLFVENLLPPHVRTVDLTRLPDLPSVEDFEALGKGSDTFADEDKFGLIVLDEGSGNFNAREWADKSRQAMIDWLKHARKLRWHVYIIAQSANMLDKQIRDAFGEHLVTCKRMDRLSIPVVGLLGKVLGFTIRPPKIHVGIVRYGMGINDPIVDRWFYRGTGLYAAYDTEQVFDRDTSPGFASILPPFTVKGQFMNKFQIAKLIASAYVTGAFVLGLLIAWCGSWWLYKGSQNPLLTQGSQTLKQFSPKDVDSQVTIDGLMFIDGVAVAYLSDGRVVRTTEFVRDVGGVRVKVGDKWIYKKG